jgi:hypothetical protein
VKIQFLRVALLAPFAVLVFPAIFPACSAPLAPVIGCDDPRPVLVGGQYTGYDTCSGGAVHRSKIVACSFPEPGVGKCDAPDPAEPATCHTNADCAKLGPGHVCASGNPGAVSCNCGGECAADSDCGKGEICPCDAPFPVCRPVLCSSDADCEGSRLCVESVVDQCRGLTFACQSELDECLTDLDCADQSQCVFSTDHRVCSTMNCNQG